MSKGTVVVTVSSEEEAKASRLDTRGEEIRDPRHISLEWKGNGDKDLWQLAMERSRCRGKNSNGFPMTFDQDEGEVS